MTRSTNDASACFSIGTETMSSEVLKEATDATRHVNTKLVRINLLRYLQEQNDDLSNILRSRDGQTNQNRESASEIKKILKIMMIYQM